MTDPAHKSLDRLLRRLERSTARSHHGFSRAPVYLAIGLFVAYQLLVRFVPILWMQLPGGLGQADELGGEARLVWRLGLACHDHFEQVLVALGALVIIALALSRGSWPLRLVVWLAAFGIVLIDAAIVLIAVNTYLRATM
jgi:hypothetical protein